MTAKQARVRPGMKSVDFGQARALIEQWCHDHAHIERSVLVAGWIAIQMIDSESRLRYLKAAQDAIASGKFDLEGFRKELNKASSANLVHSRPAGSTTANVSRPASARAG